MIKNLPIQPITFILCLFMISGLFVAEAAPALPSIAMIATFFWGMANSLKQNFWTTLRQRKDLLALCGIVVMLLPGFLNADSPDYLLERLRIKLPFLALPLAAAFLSLDKKYLHHTLFAFFTLVTAVSVYTFGNYLLHYEEITAAYLKSKVMPTPVNHVRFSIMIAFGIYSGYHLIREHYLAQYKFLRAVLYAGSVFLFMFIHIFSVRSGLVALYGMILAEIIYIVLVKKAYKAGIAAALLLTVMVCGAFYFSPTLRNKMANTRQDVSIYLNKGYPNYNSLTTRFISYELAFEIFHEHPWFGCGPGNLEKENNRLFKERYPVIDIPIIPHNEFVYYLAATGILGLLSFTFLFMFPLFFRKGYSNKLLLMHYIVLFLSFQTEPMIETQLGVGYTIVFLFLFLLPEKNPVQSSKL